MSANQFISLTLILNEIDSGFSLLLSPIRKGAKEALVDLVLYTFEFAVQCDYHLKAW